MYYEIAGLKLGLHVDSKMKFHDESFFLDPFSYAHDSQHSNKEAEIYVYWGDIPSQDGFTRQFNTQTWSMWRNSSGHLRLIGSLLPSGPAWACQLSPGFKSISMHFSEKIITRKEETVIVPAPMGYPFGHLILMQLLGMHQGALVHAMGVDIHGKGVIFPGKSGAGKTTLSRQFSENQTGRQFSDDRIVIKKKKGVFHAYGTPWPGEAGIAENASALLAAMFFISHGNTNRVLDLNPSQAFERLMPVVSIPWFDREIVPKMLDFCEELASQVPAFELQFVPDPSVGGFIEKFIEKI